MAKGYLLIHFRSADLVGMPNAAGSFWGSRGWGMQTVDFWNLRQMVSDV